MPSQEISEMTDTEVLEAMVRYQLWVHPAGAPYAGWTACGGENTEYFAHNQPTPQDAVRKAIATALVTETPA